MKTLTGCNNYFQKSNSPELNASKQISVSLVFWQKPQLDNLYGVFFRVKTNRIELIRKVRIYDLKNALGV